MFKVITWSFCGISTISYLFYSEGVKRRRKGNNTAIEILFVTSITAFKNEIDALKPLTHQQQQTCSQLAQFSLKLFLSPPTATFFFFCPASATPPPCCFIINAKASVYFFPGAVYAVILASLHYFWQLEYRERRSAEL